MNLSGGLLDRDKLEDPYQVDINKDLLLMPNEYEVEEENYNSHDDNIDDEVALNISRGHVPNAQGAPMPNRLYGNASFSVSL